MSNIKVVDVNNEEGKEEVVEEPVETEQVKEEVVEHNNEVVDTPPTEQATEEQEHKPKPKAKNEQLSQRESSFGRSPKPKASDKVECKTCDKTMTYKNYRYRHEKLCTEEPKPVKPHAKPKAKVKMMPKPNFQVEEVYEEQEEEVIPETNRKALPSGNPKLAKEVKNQVLKPQPSNPLADITNHYQLLQQQFIQQKKEKYNNLCQSMFSSKSKKR